MVHKAEDDDFWHPTELRALQQPPWVQPGQQQQQQRQQRQQRQPQQLHSVGGRRSLQQQPEVVPLPELPRVTAFEQSNSTNSSDEAPINFTAFQGMEVPGVKVEQVTSRLWNLDRIDQRDLPLDGLFHFGSPVVATVGQGATVYVVDSGILQSHQEFRSFDGSRVRASYGYGELGCVGGWVSGRDGQERNAWGRQPWTAGLLLLGPCRGS